MNAKDVLTGIVSIAIWGAFVAWVVLPCSLLMLLSGDWRTRFAMYFAKLSGADV